MIKKISLVLALVALLLTPLAVDLTAEPYTWDCSDVFYDCYGTPSCSGDVMESTARCKFRCKTGTTYTVYFYCYYFGTAPDDDNTSDHLDIQIRY